MTFNNTMYASTHTHTVDSRFDSTVSALSVFQKAKELGAVAVAITDHGVLTGVEAAKEAASKTGIKYIPGVEAYFSDEDASIDKRMHLILLAKDLVGYHAISLAVTESNANMDAKGFPRMNSDILNKYFGKGSIGHGHVIATSACVNGVIATTLLMNNEIRKEITKLANKKKGLNDCNSKGYINAVAKLETLTAELNDISTNLPAIEKVAKATFAKKEKMLAKLVGTPEYAEKEAELNAEKEASAKAIKQVEQMKSKRVEIKLEQKRIKDAIKPFDNDKEKLDAINANIASLESGITPDDELIDKATARAKWFAELFGDGCFYCELQYHGIDSEAQVMPIIAKIAKDTNLPVIAANDAHMVSNTADEIKARQLIRSLRFNKWEELFTGDDQLYLKTDKELADSLCKILDVEIVEKAINNIKTVADQCNVVFENGKHYPKFKSDIDGENAEMRLRRLATEGIEWRFPNKEGWTEKYAERMEYELGVITKLGFCDYLCIVEDFLKYGRLLGKIDLNDERYLADPYNIELLKELAKDNVGLGIGPGRGSAVGSLVCYLIGITGIDPMKYNLLFERFLNVERVSMPDIDSDFKTDIRDKVLDYVKHVYGEDAVCCIMTRGTQAAKASIRNAARLLGSEKFNDTSKYLSLGDVIAKKVPTTIGTKLSDCEEDIVKEFGDNKAAMEILHNAKLMEGSFVNVGMHAAGVIISDNGDVKQYVPLMWNSGKNVWMTQCEKDPCEANGLLKMDFLGLRNLNIITETLKNVKNKTGKSIDIEKVPFEKEVFAKIFSSGNTNSVFQFESGGMKKMLRQFQPESIEDIILLVAAYRPGPMQYLDSIIAVKHGKEAPEYVIPEMETILGQTYGYPVYQEQIMQIFNKFAGFTLGESDIIRRYMSKKKTDKFLAYKDKFIDGLVEHGANKAKAEDFWTQLVEFSKYAFNKSHATAYAFVAYYTAWLKYHYPAEYLCSVMNDTTFDKLGGLIADCKSFGVNVRPADINASDEIFSVKRDGVVVGLNLIKSVGNSGDMIIAERNNHGQFKSFADFMVRTSCKKNVAEALIYAGAFDDFTKNRQALVDIVPDYIDILKKIKAKEDIIHSEIDENDSKAVAKVEKAKTALNTLVANLRSISVNNNSNENYLVRLENEKDKVGAFVSGHPLDTYGNPADFGCTPITDITPGSVKVMGIITNLRVTKRKSDGADLAFFTVEDQTGSIDVNCFTSTYAEFKQFITKDAVVEIAGNCIEDTDNITDEIVLKINAKAFKNVVVKKKNIVIEIESPMSWADSVSDKVKPYRDNSGSPLVVFDKMNGQFRKTDIKVNESIMECSTLHPRFI